MSGADALYDARIAPLVRALIDRCVELGLPVVVAVTPTPTSIRLDYRVAPTGVVRPLAVAIAALSVDDDGNTQADLVRSVLRGGDVPVHGPAWVLPAVPRGRLN